jgi:hypothetical protein
MSKSKLSGSKSRHVMVRYHFVREAVQEREVQLDYCPAEVMAADVLTKALARDRLEILRERLLSGMQVVCQIRMYEWIFILRNLCGAYTFDFELHMLSQEGVLEICSCHARVRHDLFERERERERERVKK